MTQLPQIDEVSSYSSGQARKVKSKDTSTKNSIVDKIQANVKLCKLETNLVLVQCKQKKSHHPIDMPNFLKPNLSHLVITQRRSEASYIIQWSDIGSDGDNQQDGENLFFQLWSSMFVRRSGRGNLEQ